MFSCMHSLILSFIHSLIQIVIGLQVLYSTRYQKWITSKIYMPPAFTKLLVQWSIFVSKEEHFLDPKNTNFRVERPTEGLKQYLKMLTNKINMIKFKNSWDKNFFFSEIRGESPYSKEQEWNESRTFSTSPNYLKTIEKCLQHSDTLICKEEILYPSNCQLILASPEI